MAKTRKNYVNYVHVTLTYTSSNCILPAHGYTAKLPDSFPKGSGACETTHQCGARFARPITSVQRKWGKVQGKWVSCPGIELCWLEGMRDGREARGNEEREKRED